MKHGYLQSSCNGKRSSSLHNVRVSTDQRATVERTRRVYYQDAPHSDAHQTLGRRLAESLELSFDDRPSPNVEGTSSCSLTGPCV